MHNTIIFYLLLTLFSSCNEEIVLPTVALIYPEDKAIMDNGCFSFDGTSSDFIEWNFDWEDFPEAQKYHLYVIGPFASGPLIDEENITSSAYTMIREGSYIIPRNGNNWTWKVRAYIDEGWIEWSENRTFDVERYNTDCPDIFKNNKVHYSNPIENFP